MRAHDFTWVLVRERDVIAATGLRDPDGAHTEADWRGVFSDYLRTRLMCQQVAPATTEIVWSLACRAPDDLVQFWSIICGIRARFHRELGTALDRLCELLPEAGADQMEVLVGVDGDVDRQEALFAMAAALLTCVGRRCGEVEEASQISLLAGEAVQEALADLARLLSNQLTDQSPFFDAGRRSVHVPSVDDLRSALSRGEWLLLVPVKRIGA